MPDAVYEFLYSEEEKKIFRTGFNKGFLVGLLIGAVLTLLFVLFHKGV